MTCTHNRSKISVKKSNPGILSYESTSKFTREGSTDLNSVSELSVRKAPSSVASGSDDSESHAAISFAGDAVNGVKDLCAICYDDPKRKVSFATHFCNECGLLGHFICGKCLEYHKKFTNHTEVRSLKAAAAKVSFITNEHFRLRDHWHTKKTMETLADKSTQMDKRTSMDTTAAVIFEKQRKEIKEKSDFIKELEIRLKRTELESKKLSFSLQLTENK